LSRYGKGSLVAMRGRTLDFANQDSLLIWLLVAQRSLEEFMGASRKILLLRRVSLVTPNSSSMLAV